MPQPVPAVPGIPAGWQPVQADFDLWVTDSFSFLSQPAGLRAQLTTALSLAAGAWTLLPLDDVLEDPYSGWSASLTADQPAYSWLCPAACAGWYEASLSAFSGNQGGAADVLAVALYLNGAIWQYAGADWAVDGGDSGSNGPLAVPLVPGDYVQAYAYAQAAVSAPAAAGQYPALELTWVSS